jgi:hypothetical protein
VAKTRGSRKAKAAKRAKPARKAARKAPRKILKPRNLELKKLRTEFGSALDVLTARAGRTPEATAKLDDARRRISQWMTDIDDICTPELQEICGPSMAIPLS